MRSLTTALLVPWLALSACGTDDGPVGEIVVESTTGMVTLLGGDAHTLYWSTKSSTGATVVEGASLDQLPVAMPTSLGAAAGPMVQVRDHVLLETSSAVLRTGVTTTSSKLEVTNTDALGEASDETPVWTARATVSWGKPGPAVHVVSLPHVDLSNRVLPTTGSIFVEAEATTERRLFRVDRATDAATALAGSREFADRFPGGGAANATYVGRLVAADDRGASWLVEERAAGATAATRAILVAVPLTGEPTVALPAIGAVTVFFADEASFYWQEGDALLTASRSGGAASIVGHLPTTAGAIAAGFVYYVDGGAIMRSDLDAL